MLFECTLYGEKKEENSKRKIDINTANDGASAKASPFHGLIV